jgi:hypothetical protein
VDSLNWRFERDTEGRGMVTHQAPPRFVAYWTSGAGEVPAPPAPCWHDTGSGDGEDGIHIFGFQWIDRRPDFAAFDRLMQDAAKAIDAWIASRL